VTPLLEVRGLRKEFPLRSALLRRRRGAVVAVADVDLSLEAGEILALVGESGSGKTTLGRAILRLIEPSAGSIRFRGEELRTLSGRDLRRRRRHLQMVFQDPYGSLDPRMRVGEAVIEPLLVHGLARRADRRGEERRLLTEVGLPEDAAERYPHEFSGGQRQRIGIARALATSPDLLIADEPVSALDVSVRAQVVNLLAELRDRRGLGMLFISHDLALVGRIADRIAVLYLGRVVEEAAAEELWRRPLHPYTVALLSAVLETTSGRRSERIRLAGDPPSPANPPRACAFHPRCPIARERCRSEAPPLAELSRGHRVACHYPGELSAARVALPTKVEPFPFPDVKRDAPRMGANQRGYEV
jgi:oligopeptide/dipeptide ABC transporter ATP-binding protein